MASEGTTEQGSDLSAETTPASERPWSLILAWVALGISLLALAVSIAQTTIAREDASAARNSSARLVEGLARKVFVDADFDSVTVSNVGTLPIRDVTVYRADDHGKPLAAYAFERSVPGCVAFRWEGEIRVNVTIGFQDADGRNWLLADDTGLRRQTAATFIPS